MTAAARQPDELVITITGQLGDKTYHLGHATIDRTENAETVLTGLLSGIAEAMAANRLSRTGC